MSENFGGRGQDLQALHARLKSVAAERDALIVKREQRSTGTQQRWAEQMALRSAIHRTCSDAERIVAAARASLTDGSYWWLTGARRNAPSDGGAATETTSSISGELDASLGVRPRGA